MRIGLDTVSRNSGSSNAVEYAIRNRKYTGSVWLPVLFGDSLCFHTEVRPRAARPIFDQDDSLFPLKYSRPQLTDRSPLGKSRVKIALDSTHSAGNTGAIFVGATFNLFMSLPKEERYCTIPSEGQFLTPQ